MRGYQPLFQTVYQYLVEFNGLEDLFAPLTPVIPCAPFYGHLFAPRTSHASPRPPDEHHGSRFSVGAADQLRLPAPLSGHFSASLASLASPQPLG